jgi:SAM-dependent methyltransferase
MNWRYKAALQYAFSSLPKGEDLNYIFQKHVTRTLSDEPVGFESVMNNARYHTSAVQRHLRVQVSQAVFYEFGAGSLLGIPLALFCSGIDHQILVDIRRLVKPRLVNIIVKKLQNLGPEAGMQRKPSEWSGSGGFPEFTMWLRTYFGIEYRAPSDARKTELEPGSVDAITSTNTLEHIPPHDIQAILIECRRILRDHGVMSFRIDYSDHYKSFDRSISAYNFLRYSDRQWRLFNPPLHYQNRLRHRDYVDLFKRTGFEIVEEMPGSVSEPDLGLVSRMPLASRFREYSVADLAVQNSFFLLRK